MARGTRRAAGPPAGGRVTAVKPGGVRASKKQEAVTAGRNTKATGKDKTSVSSASKIHHMDVVLRKMSHNIPAAALQVAHQKPLPSLEKLMLPKRIDIIQQPRKC
ncbi:death-associated protein-like 1 isoform X2 [Coturnix japonica]|uniref:death-associated protein-like 1 isoform X2 n=1 Tax=Coturnix japonica TaxID=93934 RepID=UPI000777794C|nr:death-associated protein-like 1 isoform X2 [Coturnix japonica]